MFLEWVLVGLAFAIGFALLPFIFYFVAILLAVVVFAIAFVIGVLTYLAKGLGGERFKKMKAKLDMKGKLGKFETWLNRKQK